MPWTLAVILLILGVVALAIIVLVIRNNQLSLACDLCAEALRQVNQQREQRHALVPEYVSVALRYRDAPRLAAHISEVSRALATAVSADRPQDIGPAEENLTTRIESLALASGIAEVAAPSPGSSPTAGVGLGPSPDATSSPTATPSTHDRTAIQLHDLNENLAMIEHRISAAVRYYNIVTTQYAAMRRRLCSLPLTGVHTPRAQIAYTPNEFPDTPNSTIDSGADTDYRPGSVLG